MAQVEALGLVLIPDPQSPCAAGQPKRKRKVSLLLLGESLLFTHSVDPGMGSRVANWELRAGHVGGIGGLCI